MLTANPAGVPGPRRPRMRKEAVFGLIAAGIPLIGYLLFQLTPLVISFVTMFVDMKGYQLDTMVWNLSLIHI